MNLHVALTQAVLLCTAMGLFRGLVSLATARPYLWTLLLLWASVQMWYLVAESSSFHASQRSENKFWMLSSSFLASSLLFAPDSPLAVSNNFARIALVFVSTFASHLIHKNAHRRQLANRSNIHHSKSYVNAIGMLAREGGDEITSRVNSLLSRLDSPYIPGGVKRYLDSSHLEYERQLLQMFRAASREELNFLVLHVNLNAVLYHLKNRTKPSKTGGRPIVLEDNRNALVELLARNRIADLTTAARASVLDALQVVGLMRNPYTMQAVSSLAANILLSTVGAHLSDLKSITDNKASVNSMHKLVYNDVSEETRRVLLEHFAANRSARPVGRKVISDVDDTLLCSGGRYPAGIDATYPRHVIYPGAGAFYEELDVSGRRRNGSGEDDETHAGNLVFISARPHVYKDVSEKRVYAKFERLLKSRSLHAMPTLLPGDLESGQAYLLRGDFEPMARKKLRNMVEYHAIYPEFSHVFVCDNGQADVRAAELMKEKLGAALECVFVHEVQPRDLTFGFTPASPAKWRQMGICFYKTFVGAALVAFERGLIGADALRRVCVRAVDDFEVVPVSMFRSGLAGREQRRIELSCDVLRAREVLCAVAATNRPRALPARRSDGGAFEWLEWDAASPEPGDGGEHKDANEAASAAEFMDGDDDVGVPASLRAFADGAKVYARYFGEGRVVAFRSADGVYEVALPHGMRGFFLAPELSTKPIARSARPAAGGLFAVRKSDAMSAIAVGAKVTTPYGEGVVRRYRPDDAVFEVTMAKWNAVIYMQEHDVSLSSAAWTWKGLFKRADSDVKTSGGGGGGAGSSTAAKPSPKPLFAPGSRVQTPYGVGVVVECDDARVVVNFEGWHARGYLAVGCVSAAPKHSSPMFEGLQRNLTDTARAAMSLMRLPTHTALTSSTTSPDAAPKKRLRVKTLYGSGEVLMGARSTDGIITVALDWGAMAYLHVSAIQTSVPSMRETAAATPSPRAAFGKILRMMTAS